MRDPLPEYSAIQGYEITSISELWLLFSALRLSSQLQHLVEENFIGFLQPRHFLGRKFSSAIASKGGNIAQPNPLPRIGDVKRYLIRQQPHFIADFLIRSIIRTRLFNEYPQ